MFIAALFTIAKSCQQPKCPLVGEWVKKLPYIYTIEYYSAIKKKEMLPFETTWMDLESTMLSEISQSEKDKYRMISQSNEQNKLTKKQKQTHRYIGQTESCQR